MAAHPGQCSGRADCHRCKKARTDKGYQLAWKLLPPSEAPPARPECACLGEPTGEEESCRTCRGNVRLKVFDCDHPTHGPTTTAKKCRDCPGKLSRHGAVREDTPAAAIRRLLRLPPPEVYGDRWPQGWEKWANVWAAHREELRAVYEDPPPMPSCEGRGIIICGGGRRYFPSAYVNIRILRERCGCTLPIQLWHLPGEEVPRELTEPYGVEVIDAGAGFTGRRHGGYESKCDAARRSRFREILFLDADNTPVRDPSFLFDEPAYRDAGILLWPDFNERMGSPDAWLALGASPGGDRSLETGQWVLDKARRWPELVAADWLNQHGMEAVYYFPGQFGDTDCWRVACLLWGHERPYPLLPYPRGQGPVVLQHAPDGTVLFQHRSRAKFVLDDGGTYPTPQAAIGNVRDDRLVHEDFAFACLDELRRLWPLKQ